MYTGFFRYVDDSDRDSFYLFSICFGSYALLLYSNHEYRFLLSYRSSEFISNDSINSLKVEMIGQRIILGINGHILDAITDNSLPSPGYVGLFVSKEEDSLMRAKFCGFRLYSLER